MGMRLVPMGFQLIKLLQCFGIQNKDEQNLCICGRNVVQPSVAQPQNIRTLNL